MSDAHLHLSHNVSQVFYNATNIISLQINLQSIPDSQVTGETNVRDIRVKRKASPNMEAELWVSNNLRFKKIDW